MHSTSSLEFMGLNFSSLDYDKYLVENPIHEFFDGLIPHNPSEKIVLDPNFATTIVDTNSEAHAQPSNDIEYDDLVNKCKNADVLIHDAQYIEEDMPSKHGWGHSLIKQVTQLGYEANVKNIVYFHHEPERNDGEIDQLWKNESNWLQTNNSNSTAIFAKEGLSLTF